MRKMLRSPLFWITFLSLVLSSVFIFYWENISKLTFQDRNKRILYASIFFLMIVIMQLMYLFFTKEEEREARRARREQRRKERKKARELKKIKRGAIKKLRKTFYEALKIIKTNHMYKNRAKHNYELPWYLVIGGEDADHKAILENSNLDFPINIEYRNEGDGDSESYFRWFFSEEGVFISIPKEYISLDKNSSSHPIWVEFLRLFKKERWRRPINGIIFSVDAKEILSNGEMDTNEFAKVVKEKLHGISQTFFAKIPIYMIVINANIVNGFKTFFNALTSEEKREVLGVTFQDHIEDFSQEFIEVNMSNLIQKLEFESLSSMHGTWDEEGRKNIFLFLDEFQIFLSKMGRFASKVFSNTRYSVPLMLRGIYFSDISDKQETQSQQVVTYRPNQLVKQSSGFFMPKVFERIILSETQLANIHEAYRKKFSYFWIGLFGLLSLLFAFVIFFWTSFVKVENEEVNKIKDIYSQYLSLQKNDIAPKVQLQRQAYRPKNAIQIGKLGGEQGDDLNFEFSKAVLTSYAKRQLKKISNRIETFDENTKIKIIGHTDSIGSNRANLKLSEDRARAVRDFFLEQGISDDRMISIGEGEGSPIATNQTVEGRTLNRRVEVFAYGVKKQTEQESYEETYMIDNNLSQLQRILGMLDALRSMIREEDISKDVWKPGYHSVSTRDVKIKKLYEYSLQSLLLPRVATITEKELLTHLDDKPTIQGNLKAYLMLANRERRKNEYLENYMIDRWGSELEDSEIDRLNMHFDALLETDYESPTLHQRSIFKARRKLTAHAGKAGLIYKNLQDLAKTKIPYDFQFLETLDAFPDALKGTEYRIPGFYTKEGYEKIILLQAKLLINQSMTKSWILGDTAEKMKSKEMDRVYNKILSLYFSDYRRHWDKALSSIAIPSYHTSKDLSEQLELLSSGSSPIVEVLRELKKNTYLLTPKEKAEELMRKKRETGMTASDVLGSVGAKIDRYQRVGTKIGANFAGDKYVFSLRETFKPYHQLIGDKGTPSRKLQMVLRHTEKVYQSMMDVDTAMNTKERAFKIVNGSKEEGKNRAFAIKSTLLPPHMLNWYNTALSDSWQYMTRLAQGHLDKTYNDNIWSFYKNNIAGKFPLNPGGVSGISLDDFETFFKKDGMLDKFYEQYVAPFVVINAEKGTYKIKDINGASISITKSMIDSMLAAKKIQKLFFESQNKTLHLQFTIEPKSLSQSLSAMDILYEDQDIIYEHGPKTSATFSWPTKYQDSLAKYTLYDLRSNRVVKVRGEGPWAILKLFKKLNRKILSKERMIVYYKKGVNSGAFEIKGNAVILFTAQSPFKKFHLKRR